MDIYEEAAATIIEALEELAQSAKDQGKDEATLRTIEDLITIFHPESDGMAVTDLGRPDLARTAMLSTIAYLADDDDDAQVNLSAIGTLARAIQKLDD